jgi:hypothetical protein
MIKMIVNMLVNWLANRFHAGIASFSAKRFGPNVIKRVVTSSEFKPFESAERAERTSCAVKACA